MRGTHLGCASWLGATFMAEAAALVRAACPLVSLKANFELMLGTYEQLSFEDLWEFAPSLVLILVLAS